MTARGPRTAACTAAGGDVSRRTSRYSRAIAASHSNVGRPVSSVRPVLASAKLTSIASANRDAIGAAPSISTRTEATCEPWLLQSCGVPGGC